MNMGGEFGGFALIKERLDTIGCCVITKVETGSTNNDLKQLALKGFPSGTVIIAERQTSGKGRMGRIWSSKNDHGIWMSLLLRPGDDALSVVNLSRIFAVSVVESIKKVTGIKCGIKWPNDIILDGRKVCGILCESHFTGEKCDFVVVGIGLNVNHEFFEENLNNIAISLKMYCGIVYDKQEIINELIKISDMLYSEFQKNPERLNSMYRRYSVTLGKNITMIRNFESIPCLAVEFSQEGNLIVEYGNGSREEIVSGEISIRGIYDYI